jgi:hypothetical protein
METEKDLREGHISRCVRSILITKGLIKLTSAISEGYINKLRYNVTKAYIYHIINRGNDKNLIKGLKESVDIEWHKLLLNKPNLYKVLVSSGLIALSVSAPMAAPLVLASKVTAGVTLASTTF